MKIVKKILDGFIFIFEIIIPRKKDQIIVFSSFFIFYAIFSYLMFQKYGCSDYPMYEILNYDFQYWFNIFSSEAQKCLYPLTFKHPFIKQIFSPFILLFSFTKTLSCEYTVLLIMLFFNIIASLSINVIYKYCSTLLQISKFRSVIICIFFGLFAHILLLSFIPESFQLVMIGLLIMVYYTTDNILTEKRIPLAVNILMFCYVSGVTITNGVKALAAQLFQKSILKDKFKTIIFSGVIFLGIFIIANIILYIVSYKLKGEGSFLSTDNINGYIDSINKANIFHEMLADPILFHHNYGFWWAGFAPEPFQYNNIFPVIFTVLFYLLIATSIVVNIKERSVLLLLSFLSIDIFIHIICGFGIFAPSIYCLHWLFIFPILIAWLYKKIKNEKLKIGLDILVVCMAIYFAFNNLPRIIELVY